MCLTGMSGTYTLMAGDSNMTVDAGIFFTQPTTASVGNYVWYDNNQNGIQDPGETGISGVTVTFYNASGVPVGTTVTDANGFYLFSDVTPGTYSVGFTPPVGLGFSPNNGGVFDPSNSDANPVERNDVHLHRKCR
jgi:serine-aspartate repeat-containing protein C/D/E